MAPAFKFSQSEINFGSIAFGFPVVNSVELSNASDIAMSFNLEFPVESEESRGKMVVSPQQGQLNPHETKRLELQFTPLASGHYRNDLVVDILQVGKKLLSLPIVAEVVVPKVTLTDDLYVH